MSLVKQLWIAILLIATIAFGGSMATSLMSTRDFMARELHVKNMDNATALALSMSQLDKDLVTLELLISAQFDTGHYQLIKLETTDGETLVMREHPLDLAGVPAFLAKRIPVEAPPGVALVQDGWNQYGVLTLVSDSRHTYESMFAAILNLLFGFTAGAVLTGLIGSALITRIMQPLKAVVRQAEAIGERRFIAIEEQGPLEFRNVVQAMNRLSATTQVMLERETERLEALRREHQHDAVTGLSTRVHFLRSVESIMARENAQAIGTLVIIRLCDLANLNRELGHVKMDALLSELGRDLQSLTECHAGWQTGRLSGTDMAILAAGNDDAESVCKAVRDALASTQNAWQERTTLRLPMGATTYHQGDKTNQILAIADGALAIAEQEDDFATKISADSYPAHPDADTWRKVLESSIDTDGIRIGRYPVVTGDNQLIHHECPIRVKLNGKWQSASYFMPWAARLNMTPRLDLEVAKAALRAIHSSQQAMGINLSLEALNSAGFRNDLIALLKEAPLESSLLWVEVSEYTARMQPAAFRSLCSNLKALGCKVGIEHAGKQLNRIANLHELALDYLKVDSSLIRNVGDDTGNHQFLRSLCVIAHGMGAQTFAEGVINEDEKNQLIKIGFDGFTGPAIPSHQEEHDD